MCKVVNVLIIGLRNRANIFTILQIWVFDSVIDAVSLASVGQRSARQPLLVEYTGLRVLQESRYRREQFRSQYDQLSSQWLLLVDLIPRTTCGVYHVSYGKDFQGDKQTQYMRNIMGDEQIGISKCVYLKENEWISNNIWQHKDLMGKAENVSVQCNGLVPICNKPLPKRVKYQPRFRRYDTRLILELQLANHFMHWCRGYEPLSFDQQFHSTTYRICIL